MQSKTKKLSKAVDAIMRTAKMVSCDLSRLNPLASAVNNQYQKYEMHYGPRFAIKLMKAHYNESVRYACGLTVKPLTTTWIKRNKDFIPTFLIPHLAVFRSSNTHEVRWALSLLRTYEAIVLDAVPELGTVTLPSNGSDYYSKSVKTDFHLFLEQSPFMAKLRSDFNQLRTSMFGDSPFLEIPYSTKAGPKGPTCATMGKQALAINSEVATLLITFLKLFSPRWEEFQKILTFNQDFFLNRKDLYEKSCMDKDTPLGRIAFIPSKGGKTRTVAIGNAWIQLVLQFLHKTLFGLLRLLGETDGTFNQEDAAERVRLACMSEAVWSFDLTAATDRFPLIFQSDVLKFLNHEVGTVWTSILGQMTFLYENKTYQYEVGQPMGLYGSWGMFTISHHVLIQYCAWKTGTITTFRKYAILGDDIAIWDIAVAKEYQRMLGGLDVSISTEKSFIPVNIYRPGVAEFAKRYWVKGVELSAVSPDLCVQAQSFLVFGEFLHWLQSRKLISGTVPSSKVLSFLSINAETKWLAKKRSELGLLIRITELLRSTTLVELDDLIPDLLPHLTLAMLTGLRVQNLAESLLDTQLEKSLIEWEARASIEECFDFTQGTDGDTLYFMRVLDTRLYQLESLYRQMCEYVPMEYFQTFRDNDLVLSKDLTKMLSEIEYIPRVDFDSLKKGILDHSNKKELRGKFVLQLAAKAYKLLGKAVKTT